MSFAFPQWWWALAALSLPVVIHLLSRGRRQRIAIGSVRHLTAGESRALRRLRPSGWALLLLRLLLLAALALSLAGPRRSIPTARPSSREWVLVDPELVSPGDAPDFVDTRFDELLEDAKERADSIRLLASGLPEAPAAETFVASQDAWSLLREADQIAPPGTTLNLFTLDRVGWLRGRRPAFDRAVEWWTVADAEANRWIERAHTVSGGERVVTLAESTRKATRFWQVSWAEGGIPPPATGLRIAEDSTDLILDASDGRADDDRAAQPAPLSPIRVRLTADADRQTDAWYLRRALTAVGEFTGREVVWTEGNQGADDLEVRLGVPLPTPTTAAALLLDSEPPQESCKGRVYTAAPVSDPWLPLRRCATRWETDLAVAWWVDGWGRPFLSRRYGSQVAVYELQGRFDPRWSDLVGRGALPHLLLSVLSEVSGIPGGSSTLLSDRRSMTGLERMPVPRPQPPKSRAGLSTVPELLSWLLVTLLLVLERRLSGRNG